MAHEFHLTRPTTATLTGWSFTDAVRTQDCPKCGAKAGFYCVRPSGRKAWPPHGEREGLLTKRFGTRPFSSVRTPWDLHLFDVYLTPTDAASDEQIPPAPPDGACARSEDGTIRLVARGGAWQEVSEESFQSALDLLRIPDDEDPQE